MKAAKRIPLVYSISFFSYFLIVVFHFLSVVLSNTILTKSLCATTSITLTTTSTKDFCFLFLIYISAYLMLMENVFFLFPLHSFKFISPSFTPPVSRRLSKRSWRPQKAPTDVFWLVGELSRRQSGGGP